MTTIILITVGVILVAIGATQRKRLLMLFKVESDKILDSVEDSVDVAKYKLKELKKHQKELIEQAGEIFGELEYQKKDLAKVKLKSGEILSEAKAAKKAGNEALAKSKLILFKEYENQIKLMNENVATLEKRKVILETVIAKTKGRIDSFTIKTKSLESRKKVNKVLGNTNIENLTGETLDETIDLADEKITKEELKIDYLSDESIESFEDFSDEINEEFKNL